MIEQALAATLIGTVAVEREATAGATVAGVDKRLSRKQVMVR